MLSKSLLFVALLCVTACGIKGSLTPPQQITKEERSEINRRQGRDPERPY
jgi:predicted small lipoprotein YifL